MNYQLEVKNVLNEYAINELIIANKVLIEKLSYIPEYSFYKSLERFTKKGELEKIAKGIYCKPKKTRFGKIVASEEEIINFYVGKEKSKGIIVGYKLYNKYGITTQISKNIQIYSNELDGQSKKIKNVQINKIDISINPKVQSIIEQLEILQNYNKIEDINKAKFIDFVKNIPLNYSDKDAIIVLKNIKYKKRTIALLESILNYNNVKNSLFQFLNRTSDYKIPTMEEFYEFA